MDGKEVERSYIRSKDVEIYSLLLEKFPDIWESQGRRHYLFENHSIKVELKVHCGIYHVKIDSFYLRNESPYEFIRYVLSTLQEKQGQAEKEILRRKKEKIHLLTQLRKIRE